MKNIIILLFLSTLLVGISKKSFSQVDVIGHTGAAGYYTGWDNSTTIPLDIRHDNRTQKQRINFYTDSTFRMVIDSATGRVGIGRYFETNIVPYRLDVDSGDINVGRSGATDENGYRIGGNYVLRHKGNIHNIFVGVGAGTNTTGGSNTFCGHNAGTSNTTGSCNSFYGDSSGYKTTSGFENTYIGNQAGGGGTSAFSNTVVGFRAGNNIGGSSNVYIGNKAAEQATGSANVFIGSGASALLTGGNQNICIGTSSAIAVNNTRNATAIGYHARAMKSHQMILGGMLDTIVYVGIGLSHDPVGPQRMLDVRDSTGTPQLRLTQAKRPGLQGRWTDFQTTSSGDLYIHPSDNTVDRRVGINDPTPGNTLEINSAATSATPGESGLRFTDLRANVSTAQTNPWLTDRLVLTVNDSGDMILVKDSIGSGGGSGLNSCGSGSAMNNFVAKFIPNDTTLCQSIIYDDGTNVGVGTTSPAQKLDVEGNVNVNDVVASRGGYYINNNLVLHTEGNNNVFLGDDAGPQTYAGPYPTAATFIGYKTGPLSTGQYNTFVGDRTGTSATVGNENTLVGANAGYALDSGTANTMIGHISGAFCTTCAANVLVGVYAGHRITNSTNNVAVGSQAGWYTSTGDNNTFVGAHTAPNNKVGNYLTCLGYESDAGDSLTYATAIGAGTGIYSSNAIAIGRGHGGKSDRVLMGYNSISAVSGDTIGGSRLYVDKMGGGTRAAYFNGSLYCTGVYTSSDSKLKNNVADVQNADSILDLLSPKSYSFNKNANPDLALPKGTHYGLIAQQVESVLPSLVETEISPSVVDSTGKVITPSDSVKAVNYLELIPLLIASNKQLRAELSELKAMVTNCCTPGSQPNQRRMDPDDKTGYTIPVDLRNAILLEQNSPNPFAERTTINFNLTPDIQSAQIVFYDNLGRILKSVPIAERGAGTLDVYAGNLSSGLYTYSLLADGKVVDSKKMVCNK